MAAGGPGGPSETTPTHLQAARESRWRGQGYADITKLRELSARHEHRAARFQKRDARIRTSIERLRHQATLLREKANSLRARVPEVQQQMAQNDRTIRDATARTRGIVIGSDVTELQFRNQKMQQKIVDLQAKAQRLDHRAAIKTQRGAELKVKADQLLERARQELLEGQAYRDRADRLQRATEAMQAPPPPPPAPPPPPQ